MLREVTSALCWCADARMRCSSQLLAELDAALLRAPCLAGGPPGAVLCGDMNAEQGSPALAALTSHASLRLTAAQPLGGAGFTTWKFRSGKRAANGNIGNGCCSAAAAGAHAAADAHAPPPPSEKVAAIDHVLHTATLRPVAAWSTPRREDIGACGLPSEAYPSDHIAQLFEFEWCPPPQ